MMIDPHAGGRFARFSRHLSLDRVLFTSVVGGVALCFPPFAAPAPWQQTFATYTHAIILEAFPFLILGSFLAGIIELLLPADFLPRMAKRLGIWGLPATLALAPLTPVCECGVLPIARGLLAKGLPLPHTIAYMLAAPILNPTVIVTTWLAFMDWRYPVLRVTGALVVALVVGALVWRLGARRVLVPALIPTPAAPMLGVMTQGAVKATFAKRHLVTDAVRVPLSAITAPLQPWRQRLGRFAGNVVDHFLGLAGYFLVGVLIAATLKTFFSGHLDQLGNGLLSGPLTLMLTAFVLSLCAEADAFVAASFTSFDLPAKLAFLVLGPMLDIKLLLMFRAVFRPAFIVMLCVALITLVLGYVLLVGLLPGIRP